MKYPFAFCLLFALTSAAIAQLPIEGRWDITFDVNGIPRPGWLEVSKSGHTTLIGQIVGISGSARPISEVEMSGAQFSFTIPIQWERGQPLTFSGRIEDETLVGSMVYSDGKTYSWTAVRAPNLRREVELEWGEPILLFNGSTLDGWVTQRPGETNQWVAEQGILKSPVSGANLRTVNTFNDFKLFIEFRYPEDGNSGIYLRGRHEVQIEDSRGKKPGSLTLGGVYGFIAPSENLAGEPGEWNSYEITLVGRMVSVKLNGIEVICNREIPGITGGAIDSHEGEPGPILLQGDHQPIEYRNIVLIPGM